MYSKVFHLCCSTRPWLASLLVFLNFQVSNAQTDPRYLILFQDKNGTPYDIAEPEAFLSARALDRRNRQNIPVRETDLPVNPAYVAAVAATGAVVLHTTKWFNGVVVNASGAQLQSIRSLPFYKGIERDLPLTGSGYNARIAQTSRKFGANDAIDYGNSRLQLDMLGVPRLHEMGYSGSGMLIGVFDSGFMRADQQGYLSHLYENEQIVDTYDFITFNSNVYDDHRHGLQVLSVMASKWDGHLVGAAFDAKYVLYRTENVSSETPYEEVAWLLAAERADSLGVDIINTSLGYYTFDNPAHHYTYSQMDGKTAIISRAARYAARTGILLVVSAGNEGNKGWKYITAPADVDSVLTVGAVTSSGTRSVFSSFGPNAEGVIKPDVVALGSGVSLGSTSGTVTSSDGTSFSSPLIAGFSALLWQVFPSKTAQEIASMIREMGHKAQDPDYELGYGIPYYDEVLNIDNPTGFTAALTGNIVSFSWEYLYDATADAYEIERSFNNGKFVRIASVENNQYSGDTLTESGLYRYRVRAATGYRTSAYSSVVSVQFTITGHDLPPAAISIQPNPVQDKIVANLSVLRNGRTVSARVISMTGTVRLSEMVAVSQAGSVEIPVSTLPAGLYLLHLVSDTGEVYRQKFIKL